MTEHGNNLLVIDWDYFFPNPMDGGDYKDSKSMLYDWGHRESEFMIGPIWSTRAQGFLMNGLELPRVNSTWKTFLNRFVFSDDVESYIAESNMMAGNLVAPDGDPFEQVWLYDAHHDSGYKYKTMAEFQAAGTFSCEDWMLIHAQENAELHVRYPAWKKYWETCEASPPVDVEIDRALDDGKVPPVTFSTVFLCRSGAWVPAWEDAKFFEMVERLPGDLEELGDYGLEPRQFEEAEVRQQIEAMKTLRADLDDRRH